MDQAPLVRALHSAHGSRSRVGSLASGSRPRSSPHTSRSKRSGRAGAGGGSPFASTGRSAVAGAGAGSGAGVGGSATTPALARLAAMGSARSFGQSSSRRSQSNAQAAPFSSRSHASASNTGVANGSGNGHSNSNSNSNSNGSGLPPPSPIAPMSTPAAAFESARAAAAAAALPPNVSLPRRLFANYFELQNQFQAADTASAGKISYNKFKDALASIGVKLPSEDFERIVTLYDPRDSGSIDYQAFNRRIGRMIKPEKSGDIRVLPYVERKNYQGPPLTPTLAGRLEQTVAAKAISNYAPVAAAVTQKASHGHIQVPTFLSAIGEAGFQINAGEQQFLEERFATNAGTVPLDMFTSVLARNVKPEEPKGAPDRLSSARAVDRLFANKMFTRFKTVKRAFRIFDEDHSGDVSHTEFRAGLETLGFHMSDEEFAKFVLTYDKQNTGHVTYDQFNEAIGDVIQPRPTDGIRMGERVPTPRLQDWVEPKFLQQALKDNNCNSVEEYYRNLDVYGSGVLRPERLLKAVHDAGIGNPTAEYIVRNYPLNERGLIERDTFLQRAKYLFKQRAAPSYENRSQLFKMTNASTLTSEDMERMFADAMFSRYRTVKQAFRHFDYDHNGSVSRAEFRAALASMGFIMSDFEFSRFYALFDKRGSGEMTYQDFQDAVGDVIQPHEKRVVNPPPPPHQPTFLEWFMKTVNTAASVPDVDTDAIRQSLLKTAAASGGCITHKDVIEALMAMRVQLGPAEEKRLLLNLDRDETNRIPADDFISIFDASLQAPATYAARPEVPSLPITPATSTGKAAADEKRELDRLLKQQRSTANLGATGASSLPRLALGATGSGSGHGRGRGSARPMSRGTSRSMNSVRSTSSTQQLAGLQTMLNARDATQTRIATAVSRKPLKKAFDTLKSMDPSSKRRLPASKVRHVLEQAGATITDSDMDVLLDEYGCGRKNVDYVDMMRQLYEQSLHSSKHSRNISSRQSARLLRTAASTGML